VGGILKCLVEMEQYLDIKNAAQRLHLCEDTISEYLRRGILKGKKHPVLTPNGRSILTYKWLISVSEIAEYKPPHVFSRHVPTLDKEHRLAIAWTIASEGTITINPYFSKSRKGYSLAYPTLSVSNTEQEFLRAFHEMVGKIGLITRSSKAVGNRKESGQWQLRSIEGCLRLLEQIFDYLPIKKKQAMIVMEYCRLRLKHMSKPYGEDEIRLINQIRHLNTRGRKPREDIMASMYNFVDLRRKMNDG